MKAFFGGGEVSPQRGYFGVASIRRAPLSGGMHGPVQVTEAPDPMRDWMKGRPRAMMSFLMKGQAVSSQRMTTLAPASRVQQTGTAWDRRRMR